MPTRRTVLAALAAVPLLASCSSGPGPKAPQLTLDRIWGKAITFDAGLGIDYLVDRLGLVGDTVLYAEGRETEPEKLTALDAATGDQRWSIAVGAPIPAPTVGRVLVSGSGRTTKDSWGRTFQNPVLQCAGDLLPISYVSDRGPKSISGVVGVSLTSGQPVWGFAATSEPSESRAVITAVSDSVVIITVAAAVGPDWPAAGVPLTMIAIDPATGRRLWSEPDLVGLAADGEFVVAAKRERRSDDHAVWTPQILQAGTGEPRWVGELELAHPSDHVATAAGYTVLEPDQGPAKYEVIELSTGRRLDYTETTAPRPMASEPPVLAWDSGDSFWSPWSSGFFTQSLPEGKPEHGRGRPGGLDFRPEVGVGRHLWGRFSSTQGTWDSDADLIGVVAVDRTGTPRSPSVMGILGGVNDRWLLVVASDGFAVHKITPA